jgi:hypothetical protein
MQDIDTLKEKVELYQEVKKRIEMLKRIEEQTGGLPLPEVREYISLAVQLLEKIRDEKEKTKSIEEIKRGAFKEWLEKAAVT